MSRAGLLGAGVVLLAIVGGYVIAERRSESPKNEASSAGSTKALEREVEQLRREVAALRYGLAAQQRLAATATPGPSAEAPRSLSPEIHRAREEFNRAAQIRMETALNAQGRNSDLTVQVERQVVELFQTPEFDGTHLESIECSSGLCKVSSRHDSPDAQSTFVTTAAHHAPFDTEVFYTYGEGEPPTTTLYVARGGQGLPR